MIRLAPKLALALSLFAAGATAARPERITVVCNCAVEAYQDALEGVRSALGRQPDIVNLAAKRGEGLKEAARDPGRVLIALGREAMLAISVEKPAGPVVSAMTLRQDVAAEDAPAGEVHLDVPARVLFAEVRRLFRGKPRLGILVAAGADSAEMASCARDAGFAAVVVPVKGPSDLLRAFGSLRKQADLAVTLPDGALYNSATVKRLILASLENRLPVIGFSAAFVRAGAAAGVFADFREAGRQAAEVALRLEPGRAQRIVEQPRKLRIAINERVIRLLGLDCAHFGDVEVFR